MQALPGLTDALARLPLIGLRDLIRISTVEELQRARDLLHKQERFCIEQSKSFALGALTAADLVQVLRMIDRELKRKDQARLKKLAADRKYLLEFGVLANGSKKNSEEKNNKKEGSRAGRRGRRIFTD